MVTSLSCFLAPFIPLTVRTCFTPCILNSSAVDLSNHERSELLSTKARVLIIFPLFEFSTSQIGNYQNCANRYLHWSQQIFWTLLLDFSFFSGRCNNLLCHLLQASIPPFFILQSFTASPPRRQRKHKIIL